MKEEKENTTWNTSNKKIKENWKIRCYNIIKRGKRVFKKKIKLNGHKE